MFRMRGKNGDSSLVLEILMIVIGINVALWFEGWFQDLENAEIEARYLADLRDDLNTDIRNLDVAISAGEAKLKQIEQVIESFPRLDELSAEEIAQAVYTPATYQFFTPSDFTYKSMQESGDFRLLREDSIKKSILRLDRRHRDIAKLQKNYLQALDDGYIPLMMQSFDIVSMQVSNPGFLDNQLFRNFFVYALQDTSAMIATYKIAKSRSEELIEQIETSLDT